MPVSVGYVLPVEEVPNVPAGETPRPRGGPKAGTKLLPPVPTEEPPTTLPPSPVASPARGGVVSSGLADRGGPASTSTSPVRSDCSPRHQARGWGTGALASAAYVSGGMVLMPRERGGSRGPTSECRCSSPRRGWK